MNRFRPIALKVLRVVVIVAAIWWLISFRPPVNGMFVSAILMMIAAYHLRQEHEGLAMLPGVMALVLFYMAADIMHWTPPIHGDPGPSALP